MAQFDVYRNPAGAMANVPYVLDVQADHLHRMPTRVVVPLGLPSPLLMPTSRLNPVVEVHGQKLILITEHVSSLPAQILGTPVASLAEQRYMFVNALDFLFTGI